MLAHWLTSLTLGGALTHAGALTALVSCVLAGIAFFAAAFGTRAPNWLRADLSILAVALYAFAFGRLHVLDTETSAQVIAYSLGFMLASSLEPVARRLRTDEEE